MQIEIFDQTKTHIESSELDQAPDCTSFEDYATLEDLKACIKICRNLGLKAQTDIRVPLYIAYSLKATIPYPFLTKEQEQCLAEIFPTRYKPALSEEDLRAASDLSTLRTLAHYGFDLIPLCVLSAWNDAEERRLFSAYEIWTAEGRSRPDPVLIARRREHGFVYLLARWGENLR